MGERIARGSPGDLPRSAPGAPGSPGGLQGLSRGRPWEPREAPGAVERPSGRSRGQPCYPLREVLEVRAVPECALEHLLRLVAAGHPQSVRPPCRGFVHEALPRVVLALLQAFILERFQQVSIALGTLMAVLEHPFADGRITWLIPMGCILRRRTSMEMWCPDGIGRESWDRGGRESVGWLAWNSPQVGGGALAVSVSTCGVKRDVPGTR